MKSILPQFGQGKEVAFFGFYEMDRCNLADGFQQLKAVILQSNRDKG